MYPVAEIEKKKKERVKLGHDVRAVLERAESESRDLFADEQTSIDRMLARADELDKEAKRLERANGLLDDLTTSEGRISSAFDAEPEGYDGEANKLDQAGKSARDSAEYVAAFRGYVGALNAPKAYQYLERAEALAPQATLRTDDPERGGVFVPPEQWAAELIKEMDAQLLIRSWARTFPMVRAESLGAAKRKKRSKTFRRGTELGPPDPEARLRYGKRKLRPAPMVGEITISRDWMRTSTMSADQILTEEIVREGDEFLELEYLIGSGQNESLGTLTPSEDGIPLSRDVTEGMSATGPYLSYEALVEAKYSIKPKYWPFCRWLWPLVGHKSLVSLKDNDGRPLWTMSTRAGEPDLLHGIPTYAHELFPFTPAPGAYFGILGDWRWYWIASAYDMEIQRLDELYARSNQVGYIARLKEDAAPMLEECWARLRLPG